MSYVYVSRDIYYNNNNQLKYNFINKFTKLTKFIQCPGPRRPTRDKKKIIVCFICGGQSDDIS